MKQNLDWYRRESTKARGVPVKEIEDWYLRALKRAGLSSQVSHGEFIQASFMIGLILEAFRKSLIVFHEDQWRESFHDFRFILDGKLPGKMAAGEKFLNESLVPALGSMKGQSIDTVDTWREEPVHPFEEKFSAEKGRIRGENVSNAIDLKRVFEHGLQFESSVEENGLQLVDAVAYRAPSGIGAGGRRGAEGVRRDSGQTPKRRRPLPNDSASQCRRRRPLLAGALPAPICSVNRADPYLDPL
jgi:hypothetical protein